MEQTRCRTFRELPYAMKKHWATRLHDDLRLQWNETLLSWALLGRPIHRVGETRTAIEMEDHDKANILFEGVHRTGPIMVWDRGSWEPHLKAEGMLASLEEGFLLFTLRGERLNGLFSLMRKHPAIKGRRPVWELCKEADLSPESSVECDVLEGPPRSICTGRTVEQIVRDWFGRKRAQSGLFD